MSGPKRQGLTWTIILSCFGALFLTDYAPALFQDRQFAYRDAGGYYYSLNKRVQAEWNAGRWPLWEPEENAGMPLLGNPTAAVLYPGKIVFALLPYAWAARFYVLAHSALAFLGMLILMRSWRTSWFGSALSALAYAFGGPVLTQYCNIIYLVGAAWLPLGVHSVDQWVRLGRRWCLVELAIVLSMQVLGGEPEAAYLLGVAGIGYASYVAWARARSNHAVPLGKKPAFPRPALTLITATFGVVFWCSLTLALAQWLPSLRDSGNPQPPLRLMAWMPLVVNVAWGLMAVGFLLYWRRRGRRCPLGAVLLGLAGAAALSAAISMAQILPALEFIQQTNRSSSAPIDAYHYTLDPCRLIELIWPNFLGQPVGRNDYWRDIIEIPGGRPRLWVSSLYVGALTVALALGSLANRPAPTWRVWLTAIAATSLLGSLGAYTSPIWLTRAWAATSPSSTIRSWLSGLGPMEQVDSSPVRLDGYLPGSDGSFYWWLSTILPGFRQFRYPAKLFTFTALAMAALAGFGWDGLCSGRGRGIATVLSALLVLTLAALAVVALQRGPLLAAFRSSTSPSFYGPFEPVAAYQAIIRALGQATLVFGLGLVLAVVARSRPTLAGAGALLLMTTDLAAANARYILTVPQKTFETKPQVLEAIEAAERTDPARGPFRIHSMPRWVPLCWGMVPSDDRFTELASLARDTLHPKFGIDYGIEYVRTPGVAELRDYEEFFTPFYLRVLDQQAAACLEIKLGEYVLYYPRRAYDLWNARYIIVPFEFGSWRDEQYGYASFMFRSQQIYPDLRLFVGSEGRERARHWADTRDFKVIRNLTAYPRAWIVHGARATNPAADSSSGSRGTTMQEILYAGDPLWKRDEQPTYDPRELAWVGRDDLVGIQSYLSGRATTPSETVRVTYPSPQQAILDARLDSPGLVILADVYYPGWELAIDGKPVPIYRVNGAMRGAAVRSGSHRLVYTYSPQSFRVGRAIAIAGLASLMVVGLACARWPVCQAVAGPLQ